MKYDGQINIAVGSSVKTKIWKNRKSNWSEMVEKFIKENQTAETFEQYKTATKDEQTVMKDAGGYVGGYIRTGRRIPKNITSRQLITLDIDFAYFGLWEDLILLYGNAMVLHTTHSHTLENPRYRLIIVLSREVNPQEYEAVARQIAGAIGINLFDNSTFELNRLMFWPSNPKDVEYYSKFQDGPWLDPDIILDSYADWKDSSSWPKAENDVKKAYTAAKKLADPRKKTGIVGAFCRTYGIVEAIEAFLTDVYEPTGDKDRYTYKNGAGDAGLIIYDNLHVHSHHDTDPTSRKSCNAFDLVRIHKFGDGDGSTKLMEELCMTNDRVKRAMLEEAKSDFSDPAKPDRGVVVCSVGKLHRMIVETEAALMKVSPYEIFERDDQVIRVVKQQGSAKIKPLDPYYLTRIFSRFITFTKKAEKGAITIINPPPNIAVTYLKSAGTWNLPLLAGLIYTPTIRIDGSILNKPGYDKQSGLFLVSNEEFLPMPEEPTQEEAQEALKIFDPILIDFKLSPMDRSVFLAAAMTSLVRHNFPEAPIFGFSAPIRGSGKTLLANVIHLIATGKSVIPMSEGFSEEEGDKQIFATLRQGNPIIFIDDIDGEIKSKLLCLVITASGGTYQGRPLGKSEMEDVSAKVVWLVAGKNLRIKSDMTERVLMCTINLECEKPRSRSNFKIKKLSKYIKEHRPEIIQALLTVIKAYRYANYPEQGIPQMGSFEAFSEWIREPLIWAGEADPCDTIKEIEDNDPEREWKQKLKVNWLKIFEDKWITGVKAEDKCIQGDELNKSARELAEAFKMATGNDYSPTSQTIGNVLSKIKGEPIDGYKFVRSDNRSMGLYTWKLVEIIDPLM